MITANCLTAVLPVVADSWDRLRGCDVYRLLDQISYDGPEGLTAAGEVVLGHRPDLSDYVTEAVADLAEEMFQQ